jgi:aspartate carbamoyltransferase catalytic subunit
LLGIYGLTRDDIMGILDLAREYKARVEREGFKHCDKFKDYTVANLFLEPSTRTRFSFEQAEKALGARVLNFQGQGSSMAKGESFADTCRTIEAIGADLLVIRSPVPGSQEFAANMLKIPVINAGDGQHEHPTQALLDALTMMEYKGDLRQKTVLRVGDISHSRSARSELFTMKALGADFVMCGPPNFVLPEYYGKLGARVTHDLDSVIGTADIIRTSRIQRERFQKMFMQPGEFFSMYQLNLKTLAKCKKDVLIMHGAPLRRGEEIISEVADGPNSAIFPAMRNGVYVRMALIDIFLGGGLK